MGRLLAASLSLGLAAQLCAPRAARADDAACIDAHVEAQRLAKAGRARAARDALVTCATPSCPTLLVSECSTLLLEVEKSIPTIVLSATSEDGSDLGEVEVREGEGLIASRLDGKALEIDPGEHTLRFRFRGAEQSVRVIILEGDKNRPIRARFGAVASSAPSAPSAERDVSPGFWVSGSVGLLGLALFASLGGAGLDKRGGLEDRGCSPRCDPDAVDEVRGLFLGADIALGVGLAGLAVAPIFYFTSPVRGAGDAASLRLLVGAAAASLEVRF